MYAYDSAGNPLNNEDRDPYEALNSIVSMRAKTTRNPICIIMKPHLIKFTYITKKTVRIRSAESRALSSSFQLQKNTEATRCSLYYSRNLRKTTLKFHHLFLCCV